MNFNRFIVSSVCVHKIMEHTDDLSKLGDFAGYVRKRLCRFMLRKVQCLRNNSSSFLRIT